MVLFDVGEDRFHFVTPSLSFFHTPLTVESDIGLGLVPFQIFIDLDDPVSFSFVAGSVQWTSGAILGLILLEVLDKFHPLSHGANIIILLSVIEKLIARKAVFVFKAAFLLFVEQAVFDKCFNFHIPHRPSGWPVPCHNCPGAEQGGLNVSECPSGWGGWCS